MEIIIVIIFAIVIFVIISNMKTDIRIQKNISNYLKLEIDKLKNELKTLQNSLEQAENAPEEAKQAAALFTEEVEQEAVAFTDYTNVGIATSESAEPNEILAADSNVTTNTAATVTAIESISTEIQAERPRPIQPLIPMEKPLVNTVRKEAKFKFNSENWVGVNLLNRLGALLIIIGAIATAAFDGIPAMIRSIILFGFAFAVIGLGEFMNRKKATTASMGVTAAGVALVYVAVAAGHFFLGTLGMYPALIACIIATVIGIYLAIRYDAQVVACFALVGGYLPIFALDPVNDALTTGLAVYFILLSSFLLSIALAKKWAIANFIGLTLAIGGTIYLGFLAAPLIAFLYATFVFLVYTVLPILATYRTKQNFDPSDFVLIVINAFTSSILVFLIATRLDITHVHTFLSVIFALVYFGLAWLINRILRHQNMATIFVLKAFAFTVLFVPFTFDYQWFVVAWLLQAVVLMSFGILRKVKLAEITGLSVLGLAVLTFFAIFPYGQSQLTFNYTFLTVGLLVILGVYIKTNRQFSGAGQIFKWLTLVNLWIFTMYIFFEYVYPPIGNGFIFAIGVVVSLLFVVTYAKLKIIHDTGMIVIANVIHGLALISLWASSFIHGTNGILIVNLTLTGVAVAMIVYQNKVMSSKFNIVYKNINLVNFWLMVLFVLNYLLAGFIGTQLVLLMITFIFAQLILRIPFLKNRGSVAVSTGMRIIGLIWLAGLNLFVYEQMFLMLFMNAATQIFALLSLNDLVRHLRQDEKGESPFKILILSGYFLLILTQTIMVQGQVAFNSAIISILFVVASLIWIILGFRLKNKPLRQFGLYLSIASVVKLLVVDTWGLSTGMRIVSYLTLGVVLMLISFIYQRFNKENSE